MASNKIDMNKIIADLGKKNKPTEATRLSDEFPELAKSFKDGAFPVPSFPGSTVPRLKPKSERASFDLTDAQKEIRWRFVGRDANGRKRFEQVDVSSLGHPGLRPSQKKFEPKQRNSPGRFIQEATVTNLEATVDHEYAGQYVNIIFNVSYGFGSTAEEYFHWHKKMMEDALDIHYRFQRSSHHMRRHHHSNGVYVEVGVPFDVLEVLISLGYLDGGLMIYVDDKLIDLIKNKQI